MTRKRRLSLIALSVTLAWLALVFKELDRLVSQVRTGQGFSIGDATSLTAFAHLDQWVMGQSSPEFEWQVLPFIWVYFALDSVFILVYGLLIWMVVDRTVATSRSRLHGRVLLGLLIAADVVENCLLLVAGAVAQSPGGVDYGLAQAQATFSVVKWCMLLLIVLLVVRQPDAMTKARRSIVRALRAVSVQRPSLFIVIVLAVVSVLPFHPILEQVPDIQRSWLDSDKWHGGLIAAGVLVSLFFCFWFLGRAMAERSVGTRRVHTGVNYLIWMAFPAAVSVAGLVLQKVSSDETMLDRVPFHVFLGVTLTILLLSAAPDVATWIRTRWRRERTQPSPSNSTRRELPALVPRPSARFDVSGKVPQPASVLVTVSDARWAGAVLSALIVVLPALGFARSVSTGLILTLAAPAGDTLPVSADPVNNAALAAVSGSLIALMLTIAVSVLAIATGPLAGADAVSATPLTESARWRIGSGLTAGVLVVALSASMLWPSGLGHVIGPVAVSVGLLGAQAVLLGLLTIVLSFRAPLRFFRWFGLRADPVLSLFLIVPVAVGQLSGTPTLHSIDRLTQPVASERPDLAQAFDAWLVRNHGCTAEVVGLDGSAHEIRPLALVAAEGGGIRAAVWTVSVMSELVSAGRCAANAVFLSSGVSGGSLGLAIAANPPWSPDDLAQADDSAFEVMASDLRAAAHGISTSSALAAALQGLLVTDSLAATTGIRIPSTEASAAGSITRSSAPGTWRDRASLIEHSWRVAYPPLSQPFDATAAAPTGLVVLNSTDVRSGCRVVVSQVELGPGQSGATTPQDQLPSYDPTANCREGIAEPALTVDLVDRFERCSQKSVDWATASLLSARFPAVTPSGTIGSGQLHECSRPRLQMVDGGYAENSGLGLLADTAPGLGEIIRDYNTLRRAEGEPLVVPYIIYIENSPAPVFGTADDTNELMVPLAGYSARGSQTAPPGLDPALPGVNRQAVPGRCHATRRLPAQ